MNFVVTFTKRDLTGVEVSRDTIIEGSWQTIVRLAHEQGVFPERVTRIIETGYQ
jgi:hypothetical protein